MSDEKDDEDGIHRVDTVPPPAGEDDPYNAPTKVGPMADAAVRELMHAAQLRAAELTQRNADSAKAAKEKASASAPAAPKKPPAPSEGSVSAPSAVPTGPVTGRVAGPLIGPVGRTVASAPPPSAKPASVPKPPRPAARPDDRRPEPVIPIPLAAMPPPPKKAAPTADAIGDASPTSDDAAPPRVYETDESDEAATLLHASERPPRQEHTARIPSATPAVALPEGAPASVPVSIPAPDSVSPRPREPIPFDRPPAPPLEALVGRDGQSEQRILIMPLVVGFLIFAIGLAFYIWAR